MSDEAGSPAPEPEPLDEPKRLQLSELELKALSERLDQERLEKADYAVLKAVIATMLFLRRIRERSDISMARVLRMVFGARTEKTRNVLSTDKPKTTAKRKRKKKRKGHGRRAASEYWGAEQRQIPHPDLSAGQRCPACGEANLYDINRPSTIVCLVASPPITGTVYSMQVLRCTGCGETFTAPAPPEAQQPKHAPSLAPVLAGMRYGYGLPTHRTEQMQEDAGVPLPSGTQWDLLNEFAEELDPTFRELIHQGADGELFHNDDSVCRILALEKAIRQGEAEPIGSGKNKRTGIFTTAVISVKAQRKIALFFSGREHAGENLQKVLDHRAEGLPTPMQMSDGLDRNTPAKTPTDQANCNAHGRRGFVDVATKFPDEVAYVLGVIQQVYKHDKQAEDQGLDAQQRLLYHQQHSAKPMAELKAWMDRKMAAKEVEPNSSLGEAIGYMQKRWDRLTLFLRKPAAPLDNNIAERALKLVIRHRNNSLFYKTENGAHVGDLFMSLIHTCRLCAASPFDYLLALRQHIARVRNAPALWMPWNYKATLAAMTGG